MIYRSSFVYISLTIIVFTNVVVVAAAQKCQAGCHCMDIKDYLDFPILTTVLCEQIKDFPEVISNETEFIDFSGTQIKELPQNLSKILPRLKAIHMNENNITELAESTFSNLADLTDLQLKSNNIVELGGYLFTGIKVTRMTINLQENKIQTIDKNAFKGLSAYTNLKLRSNMIETLHKDVFSEIRNLRTLELTDNKISTLNEELFNNLHSLFYLKLGKNRIEKLNEKLFQKMDSLETLDLSENRLKMLPSNLFQNNNMLKSLDLQKNFFTEFPHDLPSNIKVLLAENPIECDCPLKWRTVSEGFLTQFDDFERIVCSNDIENRTTVEYLDTLDCVTTTTTTTTTTTPLKTTSAEPKSTTSPDGEVHTGSAPIVTDSTIKTVVINNTKKDKNGTSWPIILGALLGVLVLLVIVGLFVYLYRRKIKEKIIRGTLSRQQKKKVARVDSLEDFEYHATAGWLGAKTAMLKKTEGNV